MAAARAVKLTLFAALASAGAAQAVRLPMQADVDKCALRAADHGDSTLQGKVRMQLLVRKTGQVYAAFIHSEAGLSNKVLENCFTSTALLWIYEPTPVDANAPYPMSVVSGGSDASGNTTQLGAHAGAVPPSVMMPSERPVVEPAEVDVPLAQRTLAILEDATAAEQGQAFLAVHKYAEAIQQLRNALAADGNDPLALRGLSQALVETRGDLAEARTLATRLSAVAPGSVVGPEAMLRVCAALRDDVCVFEEWKKAAGNKAAHVAPPADLSVRSRLIAELQPLVQAAADRLRAADLARKAAESGAVAGGAAAASAPADPCAQEQGDDKQALCVVRRCLDEGSTIYAKELSAQNGIEYVAGDWRSKPVGAGKLLVTRPIQPKATEGAAAQAARHDALWLVKMGDQFSIAPSNSEAKQITLTHNACGGRR